MRIARLLPRDDTCRSDAQQRETQDQRVESHRRPPVRLFDFGSRRPDNTSASPPPGAVGGLRADLRQHRGRCAAATAARTPEQTNAAKRVVAHGTLAPGLTEWMDCSRQRTGKGTPARLTLRSLIPRDRLEPGQLVPGERLPTKLHHAAQAIPSFCRTRTGAHCFLRRRAARPNNSCQVATSVTRSPSCSNRCTSAMACTAAVAAASGGPRRFCPRPAGTLACFLPFALQSRPSSGRGRGWPGRSSILPS